MSMPGSSPDELSQLKQRLAELEAKQALSEQEQRGRRKALLVAVVGVAICGTTVWASSGLCPNGLPFCFSANSPALASEVNHNFSFMKEWVENKTGRADAGFIEAQAVLVKSGGNLTLANGRLMGTNVANNLHIDNTVGSGGLYLNWFTGTGGVTFGNGAQGQAASLDSAGVLTANGLRGAGRICLETVNCAWESQFGCGGSGVCSAGKVMVGSRDGTSCNVLNNVYCCNLALSTTGC